MILKDLYILFFNSFICQGSNTAEFPLLFSRILGMYTAAIVLPPKYLFQCEK